MQCYNICLQAVGWRREKLYFLFSWGVDTCALDSNMLYNRGVLYKWHNVKVKLEPVTTRHAVNPGVGWGMRAAHQSVTAMQPSFFQCSRFYSCHCGLAPYLALTYLENLLYFVSVCICEDFMSILYLPLRQRFYSHRCRCGKGCNSKHYDGACGRFNLTQWPAAWTALPAPTRTER